MKKILYVAILLLLITSCSKKNALHNIDFNTDFDYDMEPILFKKKYLSCNLPCPLKNGYLFEGWYVDDEYKVQVPEIICEDVMLYAKFSKNYCRTIATGKDFSLVILDDELLYSSGGNEYGQLGTGDYIGQEKPVNIISGKKISHVVARDYLAFAIDIDGNLYEWGYNKYITEEIIKTPKIVCDGVKFKSVSIGANYVLALTIEGDIYAWGNNIDYQCGVILENPFTPSMIKSNEKFICISAGDSNSAAISEDFKLYTWGLNDCCLGYHIPYSYSSMNVPLQEIVEVEEDIIDVSITDHVLALTKSGKVYSFGKNNKGQLGNGTQDNDDHYLPEMINDIENIGDIYSVRGSSYAHSFDGKLYCFGETNQLFTDKEVNENYNKPTKVLEEFKLSEISLSSDFCIIKTMDKNIYAKGDNYYGQLGNNEIGYFYKPTLICDNISLKDVIDEKTYIDFKNDLYIAKIENEELKFEKIDSNVNSVSLYKSNLLIKNENGKNEFFKNEIYYILYEDGTISYYGIELNKKIEKTPLNTDEKFLKIDSKYGVTKEGDIWDLYEKIKICSDLDIRQISSSDYVLVAIDSSGELWASGSNTYGQLCDGTNISKKYLTHIKLPFKAKNVVTSGISTYVIDVNNNLYSVGRNNYGQLGTGDKDDRWLLEKIANNIIKVYENDNTFIAFSNNDIYICGANSRLKYGTNDFTTSNYLKKAEYELNVDCIYLSGNSCYIVSNEKLFYVGPGINDLRKLKCYAKEENFIKYEK